ncbi:MAG TPA: SMP-30/gluconolactonase/LRE family protein [Bryobacteraceae bacterium]|nr:SMP-30/gluconolactonase/LRE family protein [Bryobacteraceae bacterium]
MKLPLGLLMAFAAFAATAAMAQVFAPGAKLEKIYGGGHLTEGVAVAPDGTVFFSDITFTTETGMQAGHILRYDPKSGKTVVYRSPSGMSNGLKFDAQGGMVAAEGADFGGRRITRTDLATGKSVILAGLFEGKPFNSPNDIAIDVQGRIYFSDPRYLGHEPIEQPVMAVYRLDPDGKVHRIITDASKPNGVAISPDQKTLYVVTNDDGLLGFDRLPKGTAARKGRMELAAYDLHADGSATFRRRLVNYAPEDGPDGLVCDAVGNLFTAVRNEKRFGISVYSPGGEELAHLPTPERPTNVGFGRGSEATTLYITAGGSVYRIKTLAPGYQLPASPEEPFGHSRPRTR